MVSTAHPTIAVLAVDPDLGADLAPGERIEAGRTLVAPQRIVPRGPWHVAEPERAQGMWGLLVLEGIASGTTNVQGRSHAELLGPGDVLRPWTGEHPDATLNSELQWRVLSPLRVLILDRAFALAAGRWPETSAALMDRLVLRARRLSFQMAASTLPRTTERVLLMLWHFADLWGTVVPKGVLLRLPVTHSQLADLVGTHRPSVTTALGELRQSGLVRTPSDGSWLLRPPAPATFAELRAQVGLANA